MYTMSNKVRSHLKNIPSIANLAQAGKQSPIRNSNRGLPSPIVPSGFLPRNDDKIIFDMTSSVNQKMGRGIVKAAFIVLAFFSFAIGYGQTVTVSITGPSTICSSTTNLSFMANAVNAGSNPTYAWMKNDSPVTDRLTGPPAHIYVAQNAPVSGDKITCKVTTSTGATATSNAYTVVLTSSVTPTVTVRIDPSAPRFSYCVGENVTFTAGSAYITGSSTYIWTLNGSTVSVPNTAASISVPVSTFATPGHFYTGSTVSVDVANLSGTCLTSASAKGTLSPSLPFVINSPPNATITPFGNLIIRSEATQTITAPTGTGYTYQWKKDGAAIAGASANTYNAGVSGSYTVAVSANGCTRESPTPLVLTKNIPPVANAGADKILVLPASLSLNGSGNDAHGSIAGYVWSQVSGPSTASLANRTTANLAVTNLVYGTYIFRFTVTDDFGESASDDVTVTVNYPPNNHNWIKTTTVLAPGQQTEAALDALQIRSGQKSVDWQYFDGLGRPMQTVSTQGSPNKYDIVTPIAYDDIGRENKKYLPYVSIGTDGFYKPSGIAEQATFYSPTNPSPPVKIPMDSRPFSETLFEPSPLNRPDKDFGTGQDWYTKDKHVKHNYLVNMHGTAVGQEQVIAWRVDSNGLPARSAAVAGHVETGGFYATGQLTIKSTKDEQGNEVREYTDKEGHVILKKVQAVAGSPALNDANAWAQTYYLYDDLGNLVVVLPPEAVRKLASQ
jgi:hypothetical protein